jgi:hypothetical protein
MGEGETGRAEEYWEIRDGGINQYCRNGRKL